MNLKPSVELFCPFSRFFRIIAPFLPQSSPLSLAFIPISPEHPCLNLAVLISRSYSRTIIAKNFSLLPRSRFQAAAARFSDGDAESPRSCKFSISHQSLVLTGLGRCHFFASLLLLFHRRLQWLWIWRTPLLLPLSLLPNLAESTNRHLWRKQ